MQLRTTYVAACLAAAVTAAAAGCSSRPTHTVAGGARPTTTQTPLPTRPATPTTADQFYPCTALSDNAITAIGFIPDSRHPTNNTDCVFSATDGQGIKFRLDHSPLPTPTELRELSQTFVAEGQDGSHIILTQVTINGHRAAFTLQPSLLTSGPSATCQLTMQTKADSIVMTLLGPTTTCAQLEGIASQLDPIIGDG